MKNEVMRLICVCFIRATEVVLLFKLGRNEVWEQDLNHFMMKETRQTPKIHNQIVGIE
jgi:hypothetical protein